MSSNITEIIANTFAQLDAQSEETDPTAQYGYIPSRGACYAFLILFALSTLAHTFQAVYYRMWWAIPTIILAGCLEILGWSGRLWSSISPLLDTPFMIQIVSTIIGPTPLLAANFIVLGAIIQIMGPMYSRLTPRNYSRVFLSCDIISLVVQGAGGGIASSSDARDVIDSGSHIMLGGIVFQLVIIVIYAVLSSEFLVRYFTDRPFRRALPNGVEVVLKSDVRGDLTPKLMTMLFALSFNLVCLFIRSVYRTIELAGGWNGRVIHTEVYFNVLDGAMVILAIYTFNIAHPGYMLGPDMDKNTARHPNARGSEEMMMETQSRV